VSAVTDNDIYGVEALAEALTSNRTLTTLDLQCACPSVVFVVVFASVCVDVCKSSGGECIRHGAKRTRPQTTRLAMRVLRHWPRGSSPTVPSRRCISTVRGPLHLWLSVCGDVCSWSGCGYLDTGVRSQATRFAMRAHEHWQRRSSPTAP
jgi:hypothetical protein